MTDRLDTLTDDDLDALCRGRITRWHAEQVSAGQLRAYLEAAEWSEEKSLSHDQYAAFKVSKACSGSRVVRVKFPDGGISEHAWSTVLSFQFALESIAAIEDRGELAVWLDVREVEG